MLTAVRNVFSVLSLYQNKNTNPCKIVIYYSHDILSKSAAAIASSFLFFFFNREAEIVTGF